ncbi:hypothetical protein JAAARDRAFT_568994 [Jaapia argillacea MUCL 33604]|uniref:Cytochrome P450 n=1 Tax=Jaapia argillacea MUCL 33604 TaxID=933084 RepID=A0A067Q1P5_9AGAM|nr:hypothetical protein JAAARDRAFT_568994 [Jaapia argillacea MUCL 33604]
MGHSIEDRLILLDKTSIRVIHIPPLRTVPAIQSAVPNIDYVDCVVVHTFDGLSPAKTNPILWSPTTAVHDSPIVIRMWDPVHYRSSSVVHILDRLEDDTPRHSVVVLPLETQFIPFGMGLRRCVGLGDGRSLELVFITLNHVNESGCWTADDFKVGSLSIPHDKTHSTFAFDEVSSRVCMVMRMLDRPEDSLLIIDVKA